MATQKNPNSLKNLEKGAPFKLKAGEERTIRIAKQGAAARKKFFKQTKDMADCARFLMGDLVELPSGVKQTRNAVIVQQVFTKAMRGDLHATIFIANLLGLLTKKVENINTNMNVDITQADIDKLDELIAKMTNNNSNNGNAKK